MSPPVVPGMRVIHPKKGPGTVLEALPRGRARVRFDRLRLLPRVVPVEELSPEETGAEPDRPGPPGGTSPPGGGKKRKEEKERSPFGKIIPWPGRKPPPRPAAPGATASYRQTLEALRLGVVPKDHLMEYTVGRKKELKKLLAFLSKGRGLELIWGDYGAGKTHLLDLLENLALKEGFVTSRIVLDPQEIPPSHPQRLFKAFLRSLRYPGEAAVGWIPLFSRLTSSDDHLRQGGPFFSRYLSPVLFALASKDKEAVEWASDYIEGYPMEMYDFFSVLKKAGWKGPRPLALPDYRTFGRVYIHILGALAAWASTAGFKGLLLLVDEMEYVDSLDAVHRRLTWEVLGHFAAATLPRSALAFNPKTLYRGGQKVHRRIPLLFQKDQPLSVVLAFTPLEEISNMAQRILRRPGDNSIYIEALEKGAHLRLIRKVRDLYVRAYPEFSPSGGDLQEIRVRISKALDQEEISPREVVRTVVLALDDLRFGKSPFQEAAGPGHGGDLLE